jgi:hypothetical protein
MRARARTVLAACLLLAATFAPAATRGDFDAVVDFSVSLKTLAAAAAGEAALPAGRFFILEGTVSDLTVLDKEEGSFRARIELISGEWIGMEDVKSYTCLVDFSGPAFVEAFPARAPREPGPGVVVLNSRLLVVARPVGSVASPQGGRRILLEGVHFRLLK